MKTGRDALEEIKLQVMVIRGLQKQAKRDLDKINRTIGKAVSNLERLVKNFPKKEKEIYNERINQITKRYL